MAVFSFRLQALVRIGGGGSRRFSQGQRVHEGAVRIEVSRGLKST